MSTDDVVSITGRTTDTPGRVLVSAGTNHFVSDARSGPGEAVAAGELLLASLASCALTNIQENARERGFGLTRVLADTSYRRDPDDSTRYAYLRLDLLLEGVERKEAETLVELFTGSCPIYNTLRRGSDIEVGFRTAPPSDTA